MSACQMEDLVPVTRFVQTHKDLSLVVVSLVICYLDLSAAVSCKLNWNVCKLGVNEFQCSL